MRPLVGPSTTLLAIPLQGNEGPDLQFFLTLPKSSGFSYHGRQRTPAQAYKFRYQSTHRKFHLYILMTKLDLLQLLLVGFRMASIQINSEQCWGNRYVIRAVSVCWILHGSWGIQSLHFSFLSPVQWKGKSGQQRVMSKELDSSFFYAWEKFLKPYRIRIMLYSTKSASLLTTAKHWVFNPSCYLIPLCNLPDKSKQSILLVDPSYPSWEIKRCKTPPWDSMEFRREIMNTC